MRFLLVAAVAVNLLSVVLHIGRSLIFGDALPFGLVLMHVVMILFCLMTVNKFTFRR